MEPAGAAGEGGGGGGIPLSHLGNGDRAAHAAAAMATPVTTVMAPLGPQRFTDLVLWARQRNHLEVYTPRNAARALLRALQANRCVGVMSDIPGAGPTVDVDYCGGPAPFSSVPRWLAMR